MFTPVIWTLTHINTQQVSNPCTLATKERVLIRALESSAVETRLASTFVKKDHDFHECGTILSGNWHNLYIECSECVIRLCAISSVQIVLSKYVCTKQHRVAFL